jgi:hypothetical protein
MGIGLEGRPKETIADKQSPENQSSLVVGEQLRFRIANAENDLSKGIQHLRAIPKSVLEVEGIQDSKLDEINKSYDRLKEIINSAFVGMSGATLISAIFNASDASSILDGINAFDSTGIVGTGAAMGVFVAATQFNRLHRRIKERQLSKRPADTKQ